MENSPQLYCNPVPVISNSSTNGGTTFTGTLLTTESGIILTDENGNPISLD
jgi:hypothetical protein